MLASKCLSTNKDIQFKQQEVLKFFFKNYIKECNYFPFIKISRGDQCYIYMIDWQYDGCKLSVEQCERIKQEIEYRTKKYKKIIKTLTDELAKIHHPTNEQLLFVQYFSSQLDTWMIYDSDEYIKMFYDKYYLKALFEADKAYY